MPSVSVSNGLQMSHGRGHSGLRVKEATMKTAVWNGKKQSGKVTQPAQGVDEPQEDR